MIILYKYMKFIFFSSWRSFEFPYFAAVLQLYWTVLYIFSCARVSQLLWDSSHSWDVITWKVFIKVQSLIPTAWRFWLNWQLQLYYISCVAKFFKSSCINLPQLVLSDIKFLSIGYVWNNISSCFNLLFPDY